MSSDAADKGVHALEMRFRLRFCGASKKPPYGRVMELVDVPDSKSGAFAGVRVRVPPWPPERNPKNKECGATSYGPGEVATKMTGSGRQQADAG